MKKTLIGTAIATVLAGPGLAEAQCTPKDLAGRWDLYFITEATALEATALEATALEATALQCEAFIERDGRLEGGCITWFDRADSEGTIFSGQLSPPRGGCLITGELNPQGSTCGVEATMYRGKGMASGVLHCSDFDSAASSAALFTMIQRR
jgi:hypothetical protein